MAEHLLSVQEALSSVSGITQKRSLLLFRKKVGGQQEFHTGSVEDPCRDCRERSGSALDRMMAVEIVPVRTMQERWKN